MPLIQVAPTQWLDEALAARQGLRRYVPPAAAVPKRSAVRAASGGKTAAVIKAAPPNKARAPAPTRSSPPRDIVQAMRRGMSNAEIDALVARRVLRRPRNLLEAGAELWSVADWRAARERGLIW